MVKHRKLALLLTALTFAMFGFGFALVPIYNRLCLALGINGKIAQSYEQADLQGIDRTREITVEFVATQSSSLPWKFFPQIRKIKIHPGELAKLAFYAENQSGRQMVVQAIPSITPSIAIKYLKKTECFCFTQQTLGAHEGMNMPLLFHVDAELPKEVRTITLAYTLFDVSPDNKK